MLPSSTGAEWEGTTEWDTLARLMVDADIDLLADELNGTKARRKWGRQPSSACSPDQLYALIGHDIRPYMRVGRAPIASGSALFGDRFIRGQTSPPSIRTHELVRSHTQPSQVVSD